MLKWCWCAIFFFLCNKYLRLVIPSEKRIDVAFVSLLFVGMSHAYYVFVVELVYFHPVRITFRINIKYINSFLSTLYTFFPPLLWYGSQNWGGISCDKVQQTHNSRGNWIISIFHWNFCIKEIILNYVWACISTISIGVLSFLKIHKIYLWKKKKIIAPSASTKDRN